MVEETITERYARARISGSIPARIVLPSTVTSAPGIGHRYYRVLGCSCAARVGEGHLRASTYLHE